MNQAKLEGMRARSLSRPKAANPHPIGSAPGQDWLSGYELMDEQIRQILGNAQAMLEGMQRLRATQRIKGSELPASHAGALAGYVHAGPAIRT